MSYVDNPACALFMNGMSHSEHRSLIKALLHRGNAFCVCTNQHLRIIWTKKRTVPSKDKKPHSIQGSVFVMLQAHRMWQLIFFPPHLVATMTRWWKPGVIRRNTLIRQCELWHESLRIRSLSFLLKSVCSERPRSENVVMEKTTRQKDSLLQKSFPVGLWNKYMVP